MFAKLCVVILSIGAVACALLALRQSRLQSASELAQTQLRIMQLDQGLCSLRARIAEKVSPERVQEMAESLCDMRPLVEEDSAILLAEYERRHGLEPSDAPAKGAPKTASTRGSLDRGVEAHANARR